MPTVKELIETYGEELVGQVVLCPESGIRSQVVEIESHQILCKVGKNVFVNYLLETVIEILDSSSKPIKTPFELLDLGFCAAMCRNWEAGIKEGRTANDWETLPRTNETREQYAAKIMRHLHEYVEQRGVAVEHLAAIACNANILWHVEGRGE
jgi:hypothetical protein